MTAAPSSGKAPNEPKAKPHVAPGFQSGPDGFLYANGKRFHVKGINWWGSETVNAVPGGLQRRTMDELLDFIAEQGFNAIRLLLNHHSVLVNGKVNQGGKHHNWTDPYPEGLAAHSLRTSQVHLTRVSILSWSSCATTHPRKR